MRRLEKEFYGQVVFIWANILDKNSTDLMHKYGFSVTPEIYLVDGQEKILGFWDELDDAEPLRTALDAALSP